MAPTSKLIAPGVGSELIERIANSDDVKVTASVKTSTTGVLAPVNAWSPPVAYGNTLDGKKAKKAAEKLTKKELSGLGISSDTFLNHTGLPFLPGDAPQRMAIASKFRLHRKLRHVVSAKFPPSVGMITSTSDPMDEVRAMAIGQEAIFIATESRSEIWKQTSMPLVEEGVISEAKVYSELFESPERHSVTPLVAGHGILAADFAPDAPLLLTSGMSGEVALWSTERGSKLVSYGGHSVRTPVWSIRWSPAATYFVTGGGDASARLWRTDIPCFLRSLAHENGRHVQSVAWHPNSQVVLTATEEEVCMWDLLVPRQISRIAKKGVTDIGFSPSGVLFAAASDTAGVEVWDTAEQKLLFNQEDPAKYLAWSWPMSTGLHDGGISHGSGYSQLVGVERDGKVRLYDKLAENKPSVCELPTDRVIRPFAAQFTWKNFLMVAGVEDEVKLS